MAGREADSQQDAQKKAKAKLTDRRQVYSSRLTGSQVVRQAGRHSGMQAGSWLACGRQAEGKQAFRLTRISTASMKQ